MSLLGSLMGKVRCPNCGSYERHPRDTYKEGEIAEGNRLSKQFGFGRGDQSERAFVCVTCEHHFDLDSALIWARMAGQASERAALKAYADVQRESESLRATAP